jgi:hypothetical protein
MRAGFGHDAMEIPEMATRDGVERILNEAVGMRAAATGEVIG